MANYPQLDNARGVWNLREVYDAVMGGYWPNANAIGLFGGGYISAGTTAIDKIIFFNILSHYRLKHYKRFAHSQIPFSPHVFPGIRLKKNKVAFRVHEFKTG